MTPSANRIENVAPGLSPINASPRFTLCSLAAIASVAFHLIHAGCPAADLSDFEIFPDQATIYRAYAGTIGDRFPISVFLLRKDDSWRGSYFYVSRRLPLNLEDTTHDGSTGKGKVVFCERPLIGSQAPTGRWEGVFDEGTRSFTGTWSSPDGKTTYPITLKERYEGSTLRALVYRFSSSWTQARNNFEARRERSVVLVQFEGETPAVERINATLRAAAAHVFFGGALGQTDSTPLAPKTSDGNPFAALETAIRATPIAPHEIFFGAPGHDLRELDIYPVHNEGGLLCVRLYLHEYTGGAHGNEMDFHLTFETASGRLLDLRRDLLRPGYEAPLARTAEAQLRRKWGLKPGSSLSEGEGPLDVEQIDLPDNWFMTAGGIGFSHDPYDIACYAAGFIDYVLPWDAIRPWLRKEAPLPGR